MAEVSVENVTKTFGATKALDSVSMDFPNGGFFALLGPSGSGKTTLLRVIAGFILADNGHIRIGGEPVERVPVERRDIGMMFQNYALFPNMTVADNVGFGLRVRKVGAAEEKRRIAEALELVQMGSLRDRKPHELSGGQRQRVALARAFVTNPRVLLLDEPLSALDKALRVDMQIELKRIQREIGITTIFVTHDQEEALTLSDKIGILRNGRMVQAGAPRDVYNAPDSVFIAEFLGDANIFSGQVEGGALRIAGGRAIRIPKGAEGANTFAIRSEDMAISLEEPTGDDTDRIRADLVQRVFAGAMATCIVEVEGRRMKIVARERDLPALPDEGPVWLSWETDRLKPVKDE
ncbi:MAG: polyamine-transporting ATPase [Rhizobiaceae bacterium MnEN-MB40S]|nr:MAG: polyamine-transporting ATPase [Rhizobiaceae bacterium MnEN-MB40S]